MKNRFAFLASLVLPALVLAADPHGTPAAEPAKHEEAAKHEGAAETAHHEAMEAGPAMSQDTQWAHPLVILIGGMFVAAIAVGIVVKLNPSEEPPEADAHGHDSHGHDSHGHDAHGHDSHGHDAHGHGHASHGH